MKITKNLNVKILIIFSVCLNFTIVLGQTKKPYDRSKWFKSGAVTTDDLRRLPQAKGYGDHSGKIVIVNARLFDGTGNPIRMSTVVLEGKTISKILASGDTNYPDDAEIIAGGNYDKSVGYFIEPTIIVTTDPKFKTMVEEVFGPVLAIMRTEEIDNAIKIENDSN